MPADSVYLAWIADPVPDLDVPGPWHEIRSAAPGLLLIESGESLSRVYHELKWALADHGDDSLLVARLDARPKLKGLAPGTQAWLRERLP